MCCIAVKYAKNIGWIGCKNRDRNYIADIVIQQSNRDGMQRLWISDRDTKWSEGVNEHGLCILSAAYSVKNDEKEVEKTEPDPSKVYYSPDGRKIRKALFESDPLEAVKYIQELKLTGATYVFNEELCYLLEGGFIDPEMKEYVSEYKEIKKNEISVRTNHGILIPQLGYSSISSDPEIQRSRKSSEYRRNYAIKAIKNNQIIVPPDLMDLLAKSPDKDPFLNPIRIGDVKKGDLVTTGQLLLVPRDRTLHYRPIFCQVSFQYDKLNGKKSKTFFEIVSNRKLLSFKSHNTK